MNPQLTQLRVRRQTIVNADQPDPVNANLHGGWLVFARLGWLVLAVFSLAAFVTGLPAYFTNLQEACNSYTCNNGQLLIQSAQLLQNLGISIGVYAVFALVLTIAITMVWFIVGGVIFWRKSDEWIALLVSLSLVMFAGSGGLNTGLVWPNSVWNVFVGFLYFFALIALFLVLFLFPDGRFVPRWMILPAIAFAAFLIDTFILPLFMGNSPFISWNWPFPLSLIIIVSLLSTVAFSQLYRYRRTSNPLQRQRTRWVVFAFTVVLFGLIGEDLIFELLPQIFTDLNPPQPLYQAIYILTWNVAPVLIPLSFGIAILRSHLWEIDIIINRTLVYSTLTGTLAVVYIACILVMQALLSGFTSGNSVALVVSTLGVFALSRPLQRLIQTRIDRRFYRRKYNAARTIDAFSATLRAEVDLDTLGQQLIAVVQETMQPASASLWLKKHDRQESQQYIGLMFETVPSRPPPSPLSETEASEKSQEMSTPAPRKITRRAVAIGLTTGGLVIAGGGLSWLLLRHPSSFTYTGHTDWVYDVAWSPDGKRIASTSKDRTVQIWDASDGGHVFIYRGHTAEIYTAAWSPDGKRIASCSLDKTVQIWDASDGSHVFTYHGHRDAVLTVAWSPDGKRIASGGGNLLETAKKTDNTVQIWDAINGKHVFTYHGHTDSVEIVAWSPDGKWIASCSLDTTVQVWDPSDGSHVLTYRGHSGQVFAVAWSPDGKYLASASTDKTVQIWSAADGSPLFTYTGHTDWVNGVAWSPNGKRIASASSDKTVQVWDAADGDHIFVYNGHTNYVVTAAWSPDGKRIASSSYDKTVQIWIPQ